MKHLLTLLLVLMFVTANAQTTYDAALAKKLGADEYGMKQYVIAFLKSGPNKVQDPAKAAQIQKEHLENIMKLAAEGKLLVAGPFTDKQDIRGIFIFDVKTIEEAKELTATDPAIKNGVLVMELHPWYGSAALGEIYRIHNSITAKSITGK